MRTDEADINNAILVIDSHDEPILVALDVENNSVSGDNAGTDINVFDVFRGFPLGLIGILISGSQSTFCIRMFFPKVSECTSSNHTQRPIIPLIPVAGKRERPPAGEPEGVFCQGFAGSGGAVRGGVVVGDDFDFDGFVEADGEAVFLHGFADAEGDL